MDRSIGWVGSLTEISLADVLKKVAMEERSGDLQVITGRTIKTVYFDRGFVVFAASNLKRRSSTNDEVSVVRKSSP